MSDANEMVKNIVNNRAVEVVNSDGNMLRSCVMNKYFRFRCNVLDYDEAVLAAMQVMREMLSKECHDMLADKTLLWAMQAAHYKYIQAVKTVETDKVARALEKVISGGVDSKG